MNSLSLKSTNLRSKSQPAARRAAVTSTGSVAGVLVGISVLSPAHGPTCGRVVQRQPTIFQCVSGRVVISGMITRWYSAPDHSSPNHPG